MEQKSLNNISAQEKLPELNDFFESDVVKKVLLAVHEFAGFSIDKSDPIVCAALIQSGVTLELLHRQEQLNTDFLNELDNRIKNIQSEHKKVEILVQKMQELQNNTDVYLEAAKRIIIERAEAEGRPIHPRKKLFGIFER